MMKDISPHIFRAYDIRGVYRKDIDPEVMFKIGCATGTYITNILRGEQLTVGHDIRQTSLPFVYSFIAGVTTTGVNINFTGMTSFGQTLYIGCQTKNDLIAFVTASHLPAEWNGIKFYFSDGVGLPEEELQKIRDLTLNQNFEVKEWKQIGRVKTVDPKQKYKEFFKSRFSFTKKLRIAVDCGGGSTTLSAPEVLESVGLEIIPVYCDPDPSFSKRPSDPKPGNLQTVVDTTKQYQCDFGVAFDGDGDRSVIIENSGKILSADEVGILFGKYGIIEKTGTVIVNVECSKVVSEQLESIGYRIKQIPVGHTFLTLEAKNEQAPLGIESSGHLILPEYFLFDDALIVPLKIAEILDNTGMKLSTLLSDIPSYPRIKEEIACPDEIKFHVMDRLKNYLTQEYRNVNTLDGIKISVDEGWILIRCSNTSPIIRLTIEGDNLDIVHQYTDKFRKLIEREINNIHNQNILA